MHFVIKSWFSYSWQTAMLCPAKLKRQTGVINVIMNDEMKFGLLFMYSLLIWLYITDHAW